MKWVSLVLVALVVAPAVAEPRKPAEAANQFLRSTIFHSSESHRFAFLPEGTLINSGGSEGGHGAEYRTDVLRPVVGTARAEPTVIWVAADWATRPDCEDGKPCTKKPSATYHATVLLRQTEQGDIVMMTHLAEPFTAKAQARAGGKLEAIATKIDKGAEDAVKAFQAVLGDPVALAASISARPDVVLYGSDAPERYVGSAAVKAQLATWKLALKVRDGIQAGISPKGTVAWIAANVDALPAAKSKAKATAYRLTAICEKTGSAWQVVQLQFSFYVNPYADMP